MSSASNAKLQIEGGQTLVPFHALADSGDQQVFTSASAQYWSGRSGYAPIIYPNGIETGGEVSPAASEANNKVDVTATTCYLAGVNTSVSASSNTLSITRPATDVAKINSITINSSGAFAVVAGSDGSDANFSETRGAAGGPPWIPTGSIEVAQVRVAEHDAGPIAASEIFSTIGTHREVYNSPAWEEYNIGDDSHSRAYVRLTAALPKIHSDDSGSTTATKKVYAKVYTPSFTDVAIAGDFVPPATTDSVKSTQYYGTTIASSSSSLGQGSYVIAGINGITDPVSLLDGEILTHRFYPDRAKAPHLLSQGTIRVKANYPAGDEVTGNVTLTCARSAVRKAA